MAFNFGSLIVGAAGARAKALAGQRAGEQEREARERQQTQDAFAAWAKRRQLEQEDAQLQSQEGLRRAQMEQTGAFQNAQAQRWEEDRKAREAANAATVGARRDEIARQERRDAEQAKYWAGLLQATNRRIDMQGANGGQKIKPVPATVSKAFLQNQQQMGVLDRAIKGVTANPDAVGFKAYLPDKVLNMVKKPGFASGVEPRADVADIGSLVVHDRSGAAVTVSEYPRLKPFVPQATDDAATVLKKLNRMKSILAEETQGMADFYTPEQGYQGLTAGHPDDSDEAIAARFQQHRTKAKKP